MIHYLDGLQRIGMALLCLLAFAAHPASADPVQVDGAVSALTGSDAMAREAAIRQLMLVPHQAATRIVEVFAAGSLAARLACVELLEAWGAPIEGIDPWRRETLTPQKLEELKSWSKRVETAGPSTRPATAPALDPAVARREIAAMLAATDDKDVRIIRERLARWNETLLPLVREQVRGVPTDLARQRLTALRYRLASSDELAVGWIEGIERLASTDASVRHKALDELAQRAGAAEVPLLLELFSDPDPMMREGSLRLLHSAGGAESAAALVRLLNDPEPNVRAAVLKQLAEKPSPEVVDQIATYVVTEKDQDLVVHAVRVLREVKSAAAMECLKTLLGHESWQVRAEAVEAIGEMTSSHSGEVDAAPFYAALVKMLDDSDGFVVSRAILVLSKARLTTTVEPLMRAAERHPDLAPEIIRAVARDESLGRSALTRLTKLASSDSPRIRAAAVTALATVGPQVSGPQFAAALADTDGAVRTAGAWACLAAMETLKPADGHVTRTKWLGLSRTQEKIDVTQWYADFRRGTGRPTWAGSIAPQLEKMLASGNAEERIAAAVAMVPLALDDKAMPVILATVEANRAMADQAARALCWLPAQRRIELFEKLMALADDDSSRSTILSQFVEVPDASAADPLWNTIKADTSVMLAEIVETNLAKLYFGEQYYNAQNLPASQRTPAIEAAKQRAKGVELQRTLAMALLLRVSHEDAAEAAQSLLDDPASTAALRLDALQVLLLSKPRKQADELAVTHIGDANLRKAALPFLAGGPMAIRTLRGGMDLSVSSVSEYASEVQAIVVAPPMGLTIEPVREVLASGDDETKAYAGYLLVLLGDRNGMEPLLAYYRQQPRRPYEDTWAKLVYRAVAATNDPTFVPVLEEIYSGYNKTDTLRIRTFYWTIRSLTGEQALALRKKIRDEVGMERLR